MLEARGKIGYIGLGKRRAQGVADAARGLEWPRKPLAEYRYECANVERRIVHIGYASEVKIIVAGQRYP